MKSENFIVQGGGFDEMGTCGTFFQSRQVMTWNNPAARYFSEGLEQSTGDH